MAEYRINRDISDSNPLPTKVVSGTNDSGAQIVYEPALNLYAADFIEVPPSTETVFDAEGKMFNFRNQSMVTDVYFGFISGRTDRNVLLLPRSTSRIYNDQGDVFLWHNGSEPVRVYFQKFEVMNNA